MARKQMRPSASEPAAAKPRKAAAPEKKEIAPAARARGPTNGAAKGEGERPARAGAPRSAAEARAELLARAAENEKGAQVLRSDPLADALAAPRVVEFAQSHAGELQRRGLYANYAEAALALAGEIEDHLQALPAAATAVRARSAEAAELVSDGAALVQPARDAVLRVTRGPDGRRAAYAFGLGQVYSVRQPKHVLRALRNIVLGADQYPAVAADAGLVADDLRAIKELADEMEALAAATNGNDVAEALHVSHGALRAYFDLVTAKATLAFAGDPEERIKLQGLIPRSEDRRHHSRAANEAPAA